MRHRDVRQVPLTKTSHGSLWRTCTDEQKSKIRKLLNRGVNVDTLTDDDRPWYAALIGEPGSKGEPA